MNTCIHENAKQTGGWALDHRDDLRSTDFANKLKVESIIYLLHSKLVKPKTDE